RILEVAVRVALNRIVALVDALEHAQAVLVADARGELVAAGVLYAHVTVIVARLRSAQVRVAVAVAGLAIAIAVAIAITIPIAIAGLAITIAIAITIPIPITVTITGIPVPVPGLAVPVTGIPITVSGLGLLLLGSGPVVVAGGRAQSQGAKANQQSKAKLNVHAESVSEARDSASERAGVRAATRPRDVCCGEQPPQGFVIAAGRSGAPASRAWFAAPRA